MLAYYLQWHMEQRLAPLFANDAGAEFYQNSTPTQEQAQILGRLAVALHLLAPKAVDLAQGLQLG